MSRQGRDRRKPQIRKICGKGSDERRMMMEGVKKLHSLKNQTPEGAPPADHF